jgi:hypothetical protein
MAVLFLLAAWVLAACQDGSASRISAKDFELQYRLGAMQSMMNSEYLGQKDGRAYLRVKTMSLLDPKKWSERIAYVDMAELDPPLRAALPPKKYEKP